MMFWNETDTDTDTSNERMLMSFCFNKFTSSGPIMLTSDSSSYTSINQS